ncbi:MAG: hypothetical protein KC619_17285 [Myxococcales bacterium]|nr:hypothetical protein [Myxococcales bacterium]
MTTPPRRALRLFVAFAGLALTVGCPLDDESPPSGDDGGTMCSAPTPDECDGYCVDLDSDRNHCGSCTNDCETDCLNATCISCQNANGRWNIVGGDCPVTYCVIAQNLECGGSVSCYDEAGDLAGTGTVEVLDGSVIFSATAGSCSLDITGDSASGPCSSLGFTVCDVVARRAR